MKVELKIRTEKHVEVFWEKTQDEEIKKLFPFTTKSLEEALKLFQETLKEDASSYGKVIYFQDRYVGDIWCYGIDEREEKMAMLSIVIFEKQLWRKGIATEATISFLRDIFTKFNIEKVGAFVYSFNLGSIGVLKKVGFKEIEAFTEDGIESKYFEIYKEQ